MILLATDTSRKNGSIALAHAPEGESPARQVEILEVVPLAGGTFSAQLVPQISSLLIRHALTRQDIRAFAVASGPGSFTGLRVGLAAIKALSEVLAKPIVVVSLLEALASSSSTRGHLVAALDAGRGEIYLGEYELASRVRMRSERLMSREEFLESIKLPVVTSDDALAALACAAGLRIEQVPYPGSAGIARSGVVKLQAGEVVTPEDLEANYIRRSDAEIVASPKIG